MTEERTPERRRQIIDAAFRVFSRKGFKAATNREIGAEAGVAPGLIYWYFKDKEDLLQSVIESVSLLPPLHHMGREMRDLPPREFLGRVAMLLGKIYDTEPVVSSMRLLMAEALRSKQTRELMANRIIGPAMASIAEYLDYQVGLGAIRTIDPQVGARLFLGMLFAQGMAGKVMELEPSIPLDVLMREAVEVFLVGLQKD